MRPVLVVPARVHVECAGTAIFEAEMRVNVPTELAPDYAQNCTDVTARTFLLDARQHLTTDASAPPSTDNTSLRLRRVELDNDELLRRRRALHIEPKRGAARPDRSTVENRIPRARLDPRKVACRHRAAGALIWRRPAEPLMRPMLVVPARVRVEQTLHLGDRKWHEKRGPEQLGLEREDEALDERDRAMLAESAVPLLHAAFAAPVAVADLKLPALVGHQVRRQRPGGVEQPRDLIGCRYAPKARKLDDTPREVVEDDDDRPAGGPDGRQRERPPGHDAPVPDIEGRDVNAPHVVRPLGDHRPSRGWHDDRRRWRRQGCRDVAAQQSHHRDRSEMEAGARERLRDTDLAHLGCGALQRGDESGDVVGEAIDRDGHLHERVRAVVIDPALPGDEGSDGDEKATSGLCGGPTALDLKGEDRQAEVGRIVRPGARREPAKPGAQDSELVLEQSCLTAKSLDVGAETEMQERAIGGLSAPQASGNVSARWAIPRAWRKPERAIFGQSLGRGIEPSLVRTWRMDWRTERS